MGYNTSSRNLRFEDPFAMPWQLVRGEFSLKIPPRIKNLRQNRNLLAFCCRVVVTSEASSNNEYTLATDITLFGKAEVDTLSVTGATQSISGNAVLNRIYQPGDFRYTPVKQPRIENGLEHAFLDAITIAIEAICHPASAPARTYIIANYISHQSGPFLISERCAGLDTFRRHEGRRREARLGGG